MRYMRTMLAHICFFDISSWAFCLSLCCQDETTPRFPGKIYDFYTTGVEGKEGNDILWVFYTSRSKLRLSFASVSLKHQANTLFQTRGRLNISILSGFTSAGLSVWNSPFEFSIVLASSGPYEPLLARSGYPGQYASFYNNPIVMICATVTAFTLL